MDAGEGRASGRPAGIWPGWRAWSRRLVCRGGAPVATGLAGSQAWSRLVAVWGPGRGRKLPWTHGKTHRATHRPPSGCRPMRANRGGKRWARVCSTPRRGLAPDGNEPAWPVSGSAVGRPGPLLRGRALAPRGAGHVPSALGGGGRCPVSHRWREGCRHVGSTHVVDDRSTNGARLRGAGDAGVELGEVLEGLEGQAADVADHHATGGPAQG